MKFMKNIYPIGNLDSGLFIESGTVFKVIDIKFRHDGDDIYKLEAFDESIKYYFELNKKALLPATEDDVMVELL